MNRLTGDQPPEPVSVSVGWVGATVTVRTEHVAIMRSPALGVSVPVVMVSPAAFCTAVEMVGS